MMKRRYTAHRDTDAQRPTALPKDQRTQRLLTRTWTKVVTGQ